MLEISSSPPLWRGPTPPPPLTSRRHSTTTTTLKASMQPAIIATIDLEFNGFLVVCYPDRTSQYYFRAPKSAGLRKSPSQKRRWIDFEDFNLWNVQSGMDRWLARDCCTLHTDALYWYTHSRQRRLKTTSRRVVLYSFLGPMLSLVVGWLLLLLFWLVGTPLQLASPPPFFWLNGSHVRQRGT